MAAVWCGQAYAIDNKHRRILLLVFLNAQSYSDKILKIIVVPFIHGHHLMLQRDHEEPHAAKICTRFLEAENIPVPAWSAYSPSEMSPSKYVWDVLDRQRHCIEANEAEWTSTPQATVNNLISCM